MRTHVLVVAVVVLTTAAHAQKQWDVPEWRDDGPREVLFDGTSLDAWRVDSGQEEFSDWTIRDGVLSSENGSYRQTTARFEAFHLRVEYALPASRDEPEPSWNGRRGMSAVLMPCGLLVELFQAMPRAYESVVLVDGLRRIEPQMPAGVATTDWQMVEIVYYPAWVDVDLKVQPPSVSVIHNGLVVHERVTGAARVEDFSSLRLMTSGHIGLKIGGPHNESVRFRHISVRPIKNQESRAWPILYPLFSPDSADGWSRRGEGQAEFRIAEGQVIGTTKPHQPNSFLCTDRVYSDFELDLEFLVHPELNSGLQIRSRVEKDANGRPSVTGYQVEIDPSPRAWTGGIYEERSRRGWLAHLKENSSAREAFRQGEWNRLRVLAEGSRIRTWINGVPAADLVDEAASEGFIGLQVHSVGGREDPLEVRFRNVRIRELKPSRWVPIEAE